MEHDPGASSGSGMAYDRPPEKHQGTDSEEDPGSNKPKLSIVSELEKSGMTEVVKDFYELKTPEPTSSPGLATRYLTDTSRTKGLLLNKKAE
jgi:hypothetical protein